ncbi:MAG TPA: hypothetical protein VKK79_25815 [Candidatus Lokiarchaeia archaeon]|nr:hypothetical protein [Candidatus Lokiarchaeia archaeon]
MLTITLVCIGFSIAVVASWGVTTGFWQPIGIYPAGDGNLWETRILGFESFKLSTGTPSYDPANNQIALVDSDGDILWSLGGFAIPHSITPLPNGDLLVSDCENNQVLAIAYPSGTVTWDWQPSLINWTAVNPEWGPTHYYNNPVAFDWTHVNDADWFNHTTWMGVLISLRNWDLVVEVNYTADVANPSQASHITWWYGDLGNYTLLDHQHGPTYDANGNIWIADSDNQRVVAINYTTKTAFWTYENSLGWVRGVTPLANGNVLIAATDKVIEVTPAEQVVWSYSLGVVNAYAAVRLPNGNTVISNNFGSSILTVSPTGTLIKSVGYPAVLWVPAIVVLPALLLPFARVVWSPKETRRFRERLTRRFVLYEVCGLCIAVVVTVALPWILCATEWLPFLPNSWR